MTDRITPRQFHQSEGVDDWRMVGQVACTTFRTGSFAVSSRLVQAISQLVGPDDHPPDLDVRRGCVTVRLLTTTDDYYGLTARDVEAARRISGAGT